MVLPLLRRGRQRQPHPEGVSRNGEQERNGVPAPQGDGGLRDQDVSCGSQEHHPGRYAGHVGGGGLKARFSEQRNGHGLSVHRQPDQAASHRQAQAENRHRRPSASLHGPVELRRHES